MFEQFAAALALKPPDYQQQVLAALGDHTEAYKRALPALVDAAHDEALKEG